jgi:hypothetical protein
MDYLKKILIAGAIAYVFMPKAIAQGVYPGNTVFVNIVTGATTGGGSTVGQIPNAGQSQHLVNAYLRDAPSHTCTTAGVTMQLVISGGFDGIHFSTVANTAPSGSGLPATTGVPGSGFLYGIGFYPYITVTYTFSDHTNCVLDVWYSGTPITAQTIVSGIGYNLTSAGSRNVLPLKIGQSGSLITSTTGATTSYLAANGSLAPFTNQATLHTITINEKGSGGNTLTVYNDGVCSTGIVAIIDTTITPETLTYDISSSTGFCYALANGTAANVTISTYGNQ